jgi:isopenicillin N synthase-like dioxygenase
VAEDLLVGLALYFDQPERVFADMMKEGNSVLRVLHYPPIPAGANARSQRAAPHEDINLITLLCEATDSGLQILTRDGCWLPVSALEGQIIVDSGDMLSRVTNGVVPSTTHRVVAEGAECSRPRYSMPFFVHPFSACDLDVLPAFVRGETQPRWPPITAGQFLEERLREIGLKPQP